MIVTSPHDRNEIAPRPEAWRVPGILAKWPLIGILIALSGALMFGAFVYNYQVQGPLMKSDVPLAITMHQRALTSPALVKDLMIVGFYIGKEVVTAIAFILIGIYLYKRYWRELAMVVIGFGGGGLLWFFLSAYFGRPRPAFDHPIWIVLKEPGFPSGHTLTAVVCYGFLAYMITSQAASRFWKWMTVIASIGIIIFIGYSRLFLGDHYLTDVLAGYALGLFWAGLVFTSMEVIFKKWRENHGAKR